MAVMATTTSTPRCLLGAVLDGAEQHRLERKRPVGVELAARPAAERLAGLLKATLEPVSSRRRVEAANDAAESRYRSGAPGGVRAAKNQESDRIHDRPPLRA